MPGRLFEQFQNSIGRIPVHLVRAVENDHAPATERRRKPQETAYLADIVNDDLATHLFAFLIVTALDHQHIRMASGGDLRENGIVTRDMKIGGSGRQGIAEKSRPLVLSAAGQHKTGKPVSKRGLTNSRRSRDHPGMRDASGGNRIMHRRLGCFMADQHLVFAWQRDCTLFAHQNAPNLLLTSLAIVRLTDPASPAASTSATLSGSPSAISRNPSRMRW